MHQKRTYNDFIANNGNNGSTYPQPSSADNRKGNGQFSGGNCVN